MTSNRPSRTTAAASVVVTSISINRAPAGTFSRFPDERLSRIVTPYPAARNASATCDPMNPAPPVTNARCAIYRLSPIGCGMTVTGAGPAHTSRADRYDGPDDACGCMQFTTARSGPTLISGGI
jgi:hypothetical protein